MKRIELGQMSNDLEVVEVVVMWKKARRWAPRESCEILCDNSTNLVSNNITLILSFLTVPPLLVNNLMAVLFVLALSFHMFHDIFYLPNF